MSLWQHLALSYDQNADILEAEYPLSATSISNKTEWIAVVVINGKGEFQKTYKIEKAKRNAKTKEDIVPYESINIPVTEKSAGRTSGAEPCPVFDHYEYLKGTDKKFDLYIKQLGAFANSDFATPQVKAFHTYISKKTVADDLKTLSPKPKTNIVFEVQIPGIPQSKVWENSEFFKAWHRYYLSEKNRLSNEKQLAKTKLSGKEKLTKDDKTKLKAQADCAEEPSLDCISGTIQPIATSHPKKISNASANAKLVSDNDTANFTFRGRFENSAQAVSIGYETSQKAHQFLRYLISDRRIDCGEQVILPFTIGSTLSTLPSPLEDTKSIFDFLEKNSIRTDSDKRIALRAETGFDYADALKNALAGFKYSSVLDQHAKTAVLALDAAIPGRLAVTFYRELNRAEYLEKIAEWHEDCKWEQRFWSDETQKYIPFIGASSVDLIIEAVLGKPRGFQDDGYTKIKKSARERLLRCIFDGAFLPTDYFLLAVQRASNPLAVTRAGKFDRNEFMQLISTACALVRKNFKQYKKEDYTLSLEPERTDRDYLYGRLLGAADKLEEYALYKKEQDRAVTAALRHMQAFSQRPFRTWQTIHGCLVPYIQTVKNGFAFKEIETVKNMFSPSSFENDAPLNGSYLIGYYHERAFIDRLVTEKNSKKQNDDIKENENE
jgi:CRISPR-associated protein Csd1